MDITRGDVEAFAEGTVEEVLSRARMNIQRVAEGQAQQAETRCSELEGEVDAISAELERERSAGQASRRADRDRVTARGFQIGRWLSRAVGLVFLVLLGLGAWVAFPQDFPSVELPNVMVAAVLGGGQARMAQILPAQDSVRLIAFSFILASRVERVCERLDIVIKKEAVPQIDMLEIRSFLAWLRRS